MPLDKDLQSIQEMRELVQKAKQAQLEFRAYDQGRVDRVVKAMADAGYDAADRLGRMAHEETGFGKPEDKKKKNEFATRRVWESIKDLRSVGVIREDRQILPDQIAAHHELQASLQQPEPDDAPVGIGFTPRFEAADKDVRIDNDSHATLADRHPFLRLRLTAPVLPHDLLRLPDPEPGAAGCLL